MALIDSFIICWFVVQLFDVRAVAVAVALVDFVNYFKATETLFLQ
jgi:hypothetical protein